MLDYNVARGLSCLLFSGSASVMIYDTLGSSSWGVGLVWGCWVGLLQLCTATIVIFVIIHI